MTRSHDTDVFTFFCEHMLYAKRCAGFDDRRLIKNGKRLDIFKRQDIVVLDETAETGGIPDDAKAHWYFAHAGVQIIENENRFTCIWQVFAKLLVAAGLWLIGGKSRFVETNLNGAHIAFENYAATGKCGAG